MHNITTKQELVNAFANHLRTQGKPAMRVVEYNDNINCVPASYSCEYRTGEGLSCGFGGLIKDEYYSEELEESGVQSPPVMTALYKSGVDLLSILKSAKLEEELVLVSHPSDTALLGDLQKCHDEAAKQSHREKAPFLACLEIRIKGFCEQYDIPYPAPNASH